MIVIGACEWIALPDFDITHLRARTDTGAKTSSLHATDIQAIGNDQVSFNVHIGSPKTHHIQPCQAQMVGHRTVRNPGGRTEERPVISTLIEIGGRQWPIEISLTNRKDMRYRMLLGRSAMAKRCLVDPGHTYLQSRHQHFQHTQPE